MSVSAAELASIQADLVAQVCDQSCTIQRAETASEDAYGSVSKPAYATVATTVCGVGQPQSTHLQNFDFLIAAEATYLVHLPVGTDVQHQDHIVVGTQTLEVHVLLTPQSYPGLLSVLCAQIK